MILVVSYLAMGVPAIVAGLLLARNGNIMATAQGFGTIVIVLAAVALAGTLVGGRARLKGA